MSEIALSNTYFMSLMNPSVGPQVDIPDDSCEQTVLRRLVLSETLTVPDGMTDVQLMFIWVPRARVSQVFVYLYVGDSGGGTAQWAFLRVINYELSLVDYFRLFRVVSGDLVIQSGTVATTLAPLSGFVNAVQTVALPDLLHITTPSQLISSRRSENGFMSQGRLVDGVVALVQPSGLLDSGYVQPDDPFLPLDWPIQQETPFRHADPANSAYYRSGRYTVEQTDEAVQVLVGPADPGWNYNVFAKNSLATLWDSAGSVAEFPLSVMGEIEVDYALGLIANNDVGEDAVNANINLDLQFSFYCDRVKPTDWTAVDTDPDVAHVMLNVNLPPANSGSDFTIQGKLRFRPTGLVRQIKLNVEWFSAATPTPTVLVLRSYRESYVSDDQPGNIFNRLNFKMVDMTTKGGWNASNVVAIVSGLSAGQVVQVTSRLNVAAIPNQENAPILKGKLTIPDVASVRVARIVLAGSPLFRGIYNVPTYQAMLTELAKMGEVDNGTLMQHAFDFGDILHGIGKVAGLLGPAVSGVVSTINPAAGAIVGGISQLLSNARDGRRRRNRQAGTPANFGSSPSGAVSPQARDSRALSRDASSLARDSAVMAADGSGIVSRGAGNAARVRVFAAPTSMMAAPKTLGKLQHFLAVSGDAANSEVHEWSVTCEVMTFEMADKGVSDPPTFWRKPLAEAGKRFEVQFNIEVDLTQAQDLLDIAHAVARETAEVLRFTFRCSRKETALAGHSWHAAALACLLGVPTGLWTGSPLTPAGGLAEKMTAAFSLGKILRVLGDSEREVQARWRDTGISLSLGRAVAMVGEGAVVAEVLPRELFGMFGSTDITDSERARLLRFIFAHVGPSGPTHSATAPPRLHAPHEAGAGTWAFEPVPMREALPLWRRALKAPEFQKAVGDQSAAAHTLSTMLENLPVRASIPAMQVCADLATRVQRAYKPGRRLDAAGDTTGKTPERKRAATSSSNDETRERGSAQRR